MNILFIQGNDPAQFQSLARLTGADAASDPIPGTHHYLHATEKTVLNGQAVLRGVDALLRSYCSAMRRWCQPNGKPRFMAALP